MSCIFLRKSWRFFATILIPCLLLPIVFIDEGHILDQDGQQVRKATKFKTLYCMVLMALFWVFELLPLAVTALLPLLLFPLLGIQDIYDVSKNYSKESNMIFLTGVIVAISLEYCNLHRRIALRTMTFVGGSSIRLLLAVMMVTAFLAMWLSSTTCVALLLPTVVAIIDEVNDSPEILTNSELKRKSLASSSTDLNSNNRRLSAFSGKANSFNNEDRRRSSMFENPGMSRPLRRGSSPNPWKNNHNAGKPPWVVNMYPNNLNDEHILETPPRLKRVSLLIHESRMDRQPHPQIQIHPEPLTITINPNGGIPEEDSKTDEELAEETKMKEKIKTMFLLAISYAGNLGGTAVITGAGPNKVFKEIIKPMHFDQDGKYRDITFFTWMAFNLLPMILNVLLAWLYLILAFHGFGQLRKFVGLGGESDEVTMYRWKKKEVGLYLRREYQLLGSINYHEFAVGCCFILVILLWILRDPELFKGWGDIYTGATSGDSTGCMVGVLLLFVIPKSWDFLFPSRDVEYEPLLDWKFVAGKLPWAVLLLLGSGFALADAVEYSGLSDYIGSELSLLEDVSLPLLLLSMIVLSVIITGFVSNVACANILLPIMISLSKSLEIHPLYLTIPVTVSCSYAFMLPVGSPTTSLVFAAGNFSSMKMAKIGLFLTIICSTVLYLATISWGNYLFDFHNYEYASYEHDSDH